MGWEENIDQFLAIWSGYWQGGLAGGSRLVMAGLDLIIVIFSSYWLIGFFNHRRGLIYLGIMAALILIITGTSYLALPGLRFLSGMSLLVLIIGLPVVFRRRLDQLRPDQPSEYSQSIVSPPTLSGTNRAVLAVVLGLVVFGFNAGSAVRVGELGQKVVITAVNLTDGTSANLGNSTQVAVVVSAPRDRFATINPDELTATVDVGKRQEGSHDLPISVNSPDQKIKVVRFRPSRVSVKIEPVISKTVGLVAKFSGRAANDLVPDEPIFQPDRVEISGPKSVVADIVQLIVPVKIDGATSIIEQKFVPVGLNSAGEIIGNLIVTPKEVSGRIALIRAGKIKTVGVRANLTGTPGGGFWVRSASVEPATVTLTGAVEALDKVTEILTEAISVAGLTEGKSVTTKLLITGVTLAAPIDKVTVKVELAALPTTKTVTPEIIYANLAGSLKVAKLDPALLALLIVGPSDLLNGLIGSEVKLNLDLSAYKSAGSYSLVIVPAQFQLPAGVGLVSFLPSAIDITLENR